MMVSQFAAVAAVTHPDFAKLCDFVYCESLAGRHKYYESLAGSVFAHNKNLNQKHTKPCKGWGPS